MKFTIMPGELRTKPLGRLAGGRAGLDDPGARGRRCERRGDDRPRLRGRLRRSTQTSAPGRIRRERPDGLRGRPGRQLDRHLLAGERADLAGRGGGAARSPGVETIVSCRLLAVRHRGAVALGMTRPAAARSSAIHCLELVALLHDHGADDGGLAEVGDELLRSRAAVRVPHRQRQLLGAAVGAEEQPEEQRERQRHDQDEDERQPVARGLQQVLAGEERGEPHANRLLIFSTAKKKNATAKPSGTSTCQRMSAAPPPRIVVSQPWSSQPLGVNCWMKA